MSIFVGCLLFVLIFVEVEVPSEEKCEEQAATLLEKRQEKTGMQAILAQKDQLSVWAKAYPGNPTIRYATGLALFSADDPRLAVEHLQAAYEISGDAQVGYLYSLALKIDRRPHDSIKILRELVAGHPQLQQLKTLLAMHLIGVQEYKEAYQLLKPLRRPGITRPNDDYAALLGSLGECELHMGEHDAAISTLQDAESYLPNAVTTINLLGEAHFKNGDFAAAETEFNRSFKRNSNVPETLYFLGLLSEKRDAQKAAEYFRKALSEGEKGMKINSDNGSDHYLLYLVCEKLHENEKAKQYKETAKALGYTRAAPERQ
jgi:tetratricopeptide (TPR) repeat protein